MTPAEKVKKLLDVTGMSWADLATKLCVREHTIYNWLKGKTHPHEVNLRQIDRLLKDLNLDNERETGMTPGEKVKRLLDVSGMTRADLATRLCVTEETIYTWLKDRTRPSNVHLREINRLLSDLGLMYIDPSEELL